MNTFDKMRTQEVVEVHISQVIEVMLLADSGFKCVLNMMNSFKKFEIHHVLNKVYSMAYFTGRMS